MRFRLYFLLCVFALGSSWAQDAAAGDSAIPAGQSAYDIFGISPAPEASAEGDATIPVLVQDTETSNTNIAPATSSPVQEAVVASPAASSDAAASDAVTSDVVTSDEEILMAEILRLLAERDTLYQKINDLEAENRLLAESAEDAGYYQARSEELEAQISALEEALAQKDLQLAEADSKLADAEAKFAATGGDADAVNAMLAAKDQTIAEKDAALSARDETIRSMDARIVGIEAELASAKADLEAAKAASAASAPVSPGATPVAAPVAAPASESEAVAAAERRVADIAAERDAALALRDAAVATRDASDAMRKATEQMLAETEAALAAAKASGAVVPASATASPTAGYLAGWKLDASRFTRNLRQGFEGSASRMGAWKISGGTASQTDATQYFSRLEMPLAQGEATTLYRFKARSTGSGWIGLGLHIYVEDNKKKRGYGEGKSLLVWFTRDRAARGDNATYLQLYRSDDDVVMERMFDAELEDGIESWRLVEVVYDPGAEYIAISVDGTLRIVYRTFFGRDSGATISLRTLGGGGSFSDFAAWTE